MQDCKFLIDVGLDYITLLSRSAGTLSGGEAQYKTGNSDRFRSDRCFICISDEPSIGLHQRDNRRLLGTLTKLRDLGNSVLVVEHDEETMFSADTIVDVGPGCWFIRWRDCLRRRCPRYNGLRRICKSVSTCAGIRKSLFRKQERGNGKQLVVKGAAVKTI